MAKRLEIPWVIVSPASERANVIDMNGGAGWLAWLAHVHYLETSSIPNPHP